MWELIIKWKKLLTILKKLWAITLRQKGSHCIIKYKEKITIIPLHGGKDLPKWTIRKILRDLNLDYSDIKK